MRDRVRRITLLTVTLVGVALAGCEREAPAPAPSATPTAALPADLFTDEAPAGARGVAELKQDQAATTDVVVRGRIGGSVKPFVDGRAVFFLTDSVLKSCDELHGDACPTPWDYCCESRDSLRAHMLTVQVVDADGQPLKLSLANEHGLEPLATVTVVGEVSDRSDSGALVVNARHLHVTPPTP